MNESTILRRIMTLVLTALLASTVFTLLAFILAGRNATIDMAYTDLETQSKFLWNQLSQHPDELENESFKQYLFNTPWLSDKYFILIDDSGNIIRESERPLEGKITSSEIDIAKDYIKEAFNPSNNSKPASNAVNVTNRPIAESSRICIFYIPVTTSHNELFYLASVSVISSNDDLVEGFANILILSTLMAALSMTVPTYLLVRRIILPIQDINDIAMAYGRGDFTVRADESHKGEVGELATSFNFLADRLSKSINDLTIERNRLDDIFNVISDGIVVFDQQANAIMANNMVHTMFNKAHKTNLFTDKLQLIPFDEIWTDIDECLATGETKERMLEGPDYAFSSTIIPKFDIDDDTTPIGATAFFRDIYDEQKLERTRRDYVANISHELRTPLQTLRGLIEPLADGMVKKEEDKTRYYNIILNETMRLSRLIDDMLELSKLQSRTLAFKTFPFDLNQLLSDLETKFRPIMHEADINFKVRFNSGKLPTVMGNPDRVEQILIILLDNAKKYTPAGKSITVYSDFLDTEGKVYISVEDTGQGIHEYDINHIFDRFFKADRARGKKGTGLGLAIAKELLTYMGEDITVKSTYGEGTTFTFTLSKAEASNAAWY